MGESGIDTSYHDDNDFSTEIKDSGSVKYTKVGTKRD